MKSLIEKIIDKLSERKEQQNNSIVIREFEAAIEDIKQMEENAEFEEAARVMIKHLCNPQKYHPHHTAVINPTYAELLEGVKSTGKVLDYVAD